VDELYVLARRVLLDALEAIGTHRDAIVLVGAQAVYLRVGEADIAVAPFTTDGDLAIDPAALAEIPPLELALGRAGFRLRTKDAVGAWVTHRATSHGPDTEVAIDLLVPASVSPGKGRRAARLRGHDAHAARIVQGLDGVLVDADVMGLASLEPADVRAFDIRVAGPAALLVAKVHKIQDRRETSRASDKDALDVLRLLRGTSTDNLAGRFRRLLDDERSATPARSAAKLLRAQFGDRRGVGVEMMLRAVGPLADADMIALSCEALTTDLLAAIS
jgi:hypothetical protein